LEQKLASLETLPEACSFAPENEHTQFTIRQLLYGPFRILFEMQGSKVYVLTVRHGARLFLSPDEIESL
jgi:plasmid stabilization system protein ParE